MFFILKNLPFIHLSIRALGGAHNKKRWVTLMNYRQRLSVLLSTALLIVSSVTHFQAKDSVYASGPGSKPPLIHRTGDLQIAFGGKSVIEYYFAKNAVLLNDDLPDEYGYFRHIADLFLDVTWGERKYGHNAVEWFIDIRQRNLWGDSGYYVQTEPAVVKFDDVAIDGHNHQLNRPLLWVRDLWLQVSIPAVFSVDSSTHHFIRGGLFSFWLGRGISLGVAYGLGKDFLGLYNSYTNDQAPPGILFTGEILKDRLTYDLYYAKFEEKSATFSQTFNHTKANHIGQKNTPWAGVAKDDELWAARLKWQALKKSRWGDLEVEPYILYNEGSDQKVEFEADAKSELGTAGLAAEYYYKNFEIGGEVAFNFGQEKLRHIDRDQVVLAASDGTYSKFHSKVNFVPQQGDTRAAFGFGEEDTLIDTVGDSNPVNGAKVGDVTGGELFNKADRFRPEFKNSYSGWMAVIDAAYTCKKWRLKYALAYGYSSGDRNPNAEEVDKDYDGFIGIHEVYSGKRVPSVFVLDARKLKRPLFLDAETADPGNDNSFTDLHTLGTGISWMPLEDGNPDKLLINPNLLFFWKDKAGFKFDQENNKLLDEKARKFLGTEINLVAKYQVLKDLYLNGYFAIFFPGSFYSDVKGLTLSGSTFKNLDVSDETGFDSPNYGLDNDTAYFVNVGVVYTF